MERSATATPLSRLAISNELQKRDLVARGLRSAAAAIEDTARADEVRARCSRFSGFVKEAWHVLEPDQPLKWSWHLDAMCDHLQAISEGKLSPWLIINVPPGSSKSTIATVMWQAWQWGPLGKPASRFLTSSFELGNVKRDTRKTRNLVMSAWFQSLWPSVKMDRTGELSFANTSTGTREGVAFISIMGKRGDVVVIDDPHSLKGAESEVQRQNAVRLFLEGGLNRLNDQTSSSIVVVMQRIHEADLSGTLLARDIGFNHLMIPMEFEPERRCVTPIWKDPRTRLGEIMDPVRMPTPALETLRKGMTAYAWAGQMQQRPTPRGGGMFKREWFTDKFIDTVPRDVMWCRHWDLAASTKKTSPYTAGVRMGKTRDGRFVIGHVARIRADGVAVRQAIQTWAASDTRRTFISLPQDPGQAGKVQAQDFIAMLAGYMVKATPETGSKEVRAQPFADQCEVGNVYIVNGDWNDDYLDELCAFPTGAYKDQVDASSGAFAHLLEAKPQIIVTQAMLEDSERRW